MIYHFEDALSDEAHNKAFELLEFRVFVPRAAVSGVVVQFHGSPVMFATNEVDVIPEDFVEVDVCPYF